MDTRLKVSIQSAKLENLSSRQKRFLTGLTDRLERANLSVMPQSRETATIDHRLKKIRQSQGVIVLAFSQWEGHRVNDGRKDVTFPTEFTHISTVMAVATARPLIVFREKSVAERGVLRRGYVPQIISLPSSLDVAWLDSKEFDQEFALWLNEVNSRRHVFLGYSSQAESVADLIYKSLTEKLNLRVFDWKNFVPGAMIWDSIERAERLTAAGIFLFMSDDALTVGEARQFAPRDNVVYEAGYFAGRKGRSHTLIIREKGAKLPTDLDGILHLQLEDRTNIAAIETRLHESIENIFKMVD